VETSTPIGKRRRARSLARWPVVGLAAALLVVGTAEASAAVSAGNHWSATVVAGQAIESGAVWAVQANGTVTAYPLNNFHGGAYSTPLAQPITGIAAMPNGNGYWLVAADGGVFSYGDAHFYGSMAAAHLNQPVVGIASTKDGRGYWLVAADGGIFTFGDAHFFGSLGGMRLDEPIVGISATWSGRGYRLVARDGGVFTFGDATYHGSLGGTGLTDVLGMAQTPSGNGYWILRKLGGTGHVTQFCNGMPCGALPVDIPSVYNFGDARNLPVSFPNVASGGRFLDLDFSGDPAVAIVGNPVAQGFFVLRATGPDVGFAGAPPYPH
jgi:hypothetical protein